MARCCAWDTRRADEHIANIRGCKVCHGKDLIDHDSPRPPTLERKAPVEYGKYLAGLCRLCHEPGFSGGPIPGTLPEDPQALTITPAGVIGRWAFEEFLTAKRTGRTPDGRQLREVYMPYKTLFGDITDEEWEA